MPNILAGFYKRSFCDLVAAPDFSGSTDYVSGSLINVNDRDKSTCAITSGKNSDATSVDFIADLGALFDIDTIALWSNFKTFEIRYWDETITPVAQVDKIIGLFNDNPTHYIINSTDLAYTCNNVPTYFADLATLINASSEPVTAVLCNPANDQDGIFITADVPGVPFTLEIVADQLGSLTWSIITPNLSEWALFSSHTSNTALFTMDEIVTAVSARYIKITTTATNPANQEKKLYELVITEKIGSLPVSGMESPSQNYVRVNTQNLRGGSIQLVTFPQSPKFHVQLNFKHLTTLYADYDAIKDALLLDACFVYLYYSDLITPLSVDALYLVNDISDKDFPLSAEVLASGVDGAMELMEL
jgi:hypothetical protein